MTPLLSVEAPGAVTVPNPNAPWNSCACAALTSANTAKTKSTDSFLKCFSCATNLDCLAAFPLTQGANYSFEKRRATYPDRCFGLKNCWLLDSSHGENRGVQQYRQIHKKVAMLDVVQIVLDILVDKERAIAAQLP